jgi:cysteine-rich repeat protein
MRNLSTRFAIQFAAGSALPLLLLFLTAPDPAAPVEAEGRVTLCHLPPGNPANPRTIEVGETAVAAHLAHGDALGACVEEPEAICGDGLLQPGEECDDGNDNPYDGCDECRIVDITPD